MPAVLRYADLPVTPWRNGRGVSRTIASGLDRDRALLWQVGIADLDGDAPFSHYPHCDRLFTPIAGDPAPALSFDDGPFEPCPLLVPKWFSGDRKTMLRMPKPGQVFNVIVDRRHYAAEVTLLTLAPGAPVPLPQSPTWVLHCLAGALSTDTGALGPGDSCVGIGSVTSTVRSSVLAASIWPLP